MRPLDVTRLAFYTFSLRPGASRAEAFVLSTSGTKPGASDKGASAAPRRGSVSCGQPPLPVVKRESAPCRAHGRSRVTLPPYRPRRSMASRKKRAAACDVFGGSPDASHIPLPSDEAQLFPHAKIRAPLLGLALQAEPGAAFIPPDLCPGRKARPLGVEPAYRRQRIQRSA